MNDTVIQKEFIQELIESTNECNIYLKSGIKLIGIIIKDEEDIIILLGKKNNIEQLVYKNAISTILPTSNF